MRILTIFFLAFIAHVRSDAETSPISIAVEAIADPGDVPNILLSHEEAAAGVSEVATTTSASVIAITPIPTSTTTVRTTTYRDDSSDSSEEQTTRRAVSTTTKTQVPSTTSEKHEVEGSGTAAEIEGSGEAVAPVHVTTVLQTPSGSPTMAVTAGTGSSPEVISGSKPEVEGSGEIVMEVRPIETVMAEPEEIVQLVSVAETTTTTSTTSTTSPTTRRQDLNSDSEDSEELEQRRRTTTTTTTVPAPVNLEVILSSAPEVVTSTEAAPTQETTTYSTFVEGSGELIRVFGSEAQETTTAGSATEISGEKATQLKLLSNQQEEMDSNSIRVDAAPMIGDFPGATPPRVARRRFLSSWRLPVVHIGEVPGQNYWEHGTAVAPVVDEMTSLIDELGTLSGSDREYQKQQIAMLDAQIDNMFRV